VGLGLLQEGAVGREVQTGLRTSDLVARCEVFDTSKHGHSLKQTFYCGVLLLFSAPIHNYCRLLKNLKYIETEEQ
jgi:hypothetical protein